MSSTTLPSLTVETAALEVVTLDLYRDVHKGIRNELFGVTASAGQVDPGDRDAVASVAGRWRNLVALLVAHAEHEDEFVQPVIELHAASLAEVIAAAHPELEAQMAALEVLADRATDAGVCDRRLLVHRMYLGFASFTAAYLQHQEFEETQVMPALAAKLGFEEVLGIHGAIIGSLTPEQMAQSGSVMLPAMNVEDRVELLGGAQVGAPPEVFAGMMALTQSVISAADYAQVTARLGIA
jgi:hypothetical protein